MKPSDHTFEFDPIKHVYTLNGKRMYGVTSVLNVISKPALIQWSANLATAKAFLLGNTPELRKAISERTSKSGKISTESVKELDVEFPQFKEARLAHRVKAEESATAGTNIHSVIEKIVKEAIQANNGKILLEEHNMPQVQQFLDWAQENETIFLHSERQLFSKELWVAGTCDLCFTRNGKKYVGDIKTTDAIWDRTPFFQMAAYSLMLEEAGEKYEGRCVIRLGKIGDIEVVESFSPLDTDGFLCALGLFKALEAPVTSKQSYIKKAINKKKYSQ